MSDRLLVLLVAVTVAAVPATALLPDAPAADPWSALRGSTGSPGADIAHILAVTADAPAPRLGVCPGLADAIARHTDRLGIPAPPVPAGLDAAVAHASACLLDALADANAAHDALFAGVPVADVLEAVEDPQAQDDLLSRLGDRDILLLRQAAAALALRVDAALPALDAAAASGVPVHIDLAPILLIEGTGNSLHQDNYVLALELAGDDVYDNHAGGILVSLHMGRHDVHDAPNGVRHTLFGQNDVRVGDHVQDADMALSASLVLDIAGNDRYGVPQAPRHQDIQCTTALIPPVVGAQGGGVAGVAMLMDLAGDDTYNGRTMAQGIGHLMGVGVLWDGGGIDTFTAVRSAQGQALLGGIGILVQNGGDTHYQMVVPSGGVFNGDLATCDAESRYAQGASFDRRAGVGPPSIGILLDRGGDDRYDAWDLAQGFGQGPGAGILLDEDGHDHYTGNARVQGAGQGRSKELNPQAIMGGGLGVLLDDAGDDTYTASREAQGWSLGNTPGAPPTDIGGLLQWATDRNEAVGLLRDGAGTDTYSQPGRGDGSLHVEGGVGLLIDT